MNSLRKAMVLLLALAWVPLASHCLIEAMPGFEFLICDAELQASTEGADPCNEGACCPVEFAKYQSPRQQDLKPAAGMAILPAIGFDVVEKLPPAEVGRGCAALAPTDLPVPWQFAHRTALPARAPSFTS